MKIDPVQFQARFVERARLLAAAAEVEQPEVDSVTLSSGSSLALAFSQTALALAAAGPAGGVPALAALSQEIARSLITAEQEEQLAESMGDAFQSRFVASEPGLEKAWKEVQRVTRSPYPAPQQVNSPLVYAQADTRNLYIGSEALAGDLADPNVLTFTLAHEEGHRQHRDSAGAKGLEAFVEAAQNQPELFALAFQSVREGRHENERRADEFGARVAARLGCDPKPILEFLLAIPEDGEHPAGYQRAQAVRETMAAEGVPISDGEWSRLVVQDPRGDARYAELGTFHQDPASWQPLNAQSLSDLRQLRLEYLQQQRQPGSLVVLDQFFIPAGASRTHGQMVAETARSSGFSGPILEMDTTYSLQSETVGKLEQIAAAEQRFLQAGSGAEARAALRELSVLKRVYSLERTRESLDHLRQSGVRQCAVNISLGHNAADETRAWLSRTLVSEGRDPEQAGKVLLQIIRAFCDDPHGFLDPRPEVAGPARARVVSALAQFLQQTVADPRWQQAKNAYNESVQSLEEQNNSVVLAAGNEGDCAQFLSSWCLGQQPDLPEGFENNDLSNPLVTVVGALEGKQLAPYTSRDSEIDFLAEGRSALGEDEKGTSFAAPRIAARLAELHGRHADLSSAAAEQLLKQAT